MEDLGADPARGQQQIRATVQRLVDIHSNLVLAWVTSGYLVALEDADYQRTHPAAGWDSLGYLIREAIQHGLAVHLWYSFTDYRDASSPDFDPKVGATPSGRRAELTNWSLAIR